MTDLLPFKPFDERGAVRIYYNGFLPHWRQAGCTYFVTFRLADSLPFAVVEEWRYERDQWLTARGIKLTGIDWRAATKVLSPKDQRLFERHFSGKLFDYLDKGCGACVLRDVRINALVANAIMYFHGARVDVGDFVVMPNHVHALLAPVEGFELEDILHSIKSYTGNQINKLLGRSGTLWMEESHDHIVRDEAELL